MEMEMQRLIDKAASIERGEYLLRKMFAEHEREANIERMLDAAGRQKVFDLVRSMGWSSAEAVPHHVWEQACADILNRSPKPQAGNRKGDAHDRSS